MSAPKKPPLTTARATEMLRRVFQRVNSVPEAMGVLVSVLQGVFTEGWDHGFHDANKIPSEEPALTAMRMEARREHPPAGDEWDHAGVKINQPLHVRLHCAAFHVTAVRGHAVRGGNIRAPLDDLQGCRTCGDAIKFVEAWSVDGEIHLSSIRL